MDDEKRQEFEKAFFQLRQAYLRRLINTIRIIDNILELEEYKLPKREDAIRAQSLVHGLAGSGTTFGFPEITEVGRDADHFFEFMIREMKEGESVNPDNYKAMQMWLKKTQQVCQEVCHRVHLANPESANSNIYLSPGTKGHAHILVVDDDMEVANAIAQGLQANGMTTQISANGEDALHYLARVRPDMILLDVALRGIDGLEVLQQIKQNSEFLDIPVILLATRTAEGEEEFARRAGALDYIRKPINIKTISGRVRDGLNQSRDESQSI